jgi:hypothetical protein
MSFDELQRRDGGLVMSALDSGCVKTLEGVIGTRQENRSCGLGDSFMRAQRLFKSN